MANKLEKAQEFLRTNKAQNAGKQLLTDEAYEHHFESILGLSNYLEANWDYWRKGTKPGMDSFNECMSQSKGLKILKNGGHYPEAVDRMKSAEIDASRFDMLESALPVPLAAVAGTRANVPAFLAGSPMSMMVNSDVMMADRRCRMLVCVNASCMIRHDTLLHRGAAIMGAIQTLSNQGYAVELTVGFIVQSHAGEAHFTVTVKDFQDTFNPATLAFVLAEPAFFRRCLFALFEIDRMQQNCGNPVLQAMKGNLGYPIENLDLSDFNVVFEPLHANGRWTAKNSADKAMDLVMEWVERSKIAS